VGIKLLFDIAVLIFLFSKIYRMFCCRVQQADTKINSATMYFFPQKVTCYSLHKRKKNTLGGRFFSSMVFVISAS